jgi:hypothetical protein
MGQPGERRKYALAREKLSRLGRLKTARWLACTALLAPHSPREESLNRLSVDCDDCSSGAIFSVCRTGAQAQRNIVTTPVGAALETGQMATSSNGDRLADLEHGTGVQSFSQGRLSSARYATAKGIKGGPILPTVFPLSPI